MSDILVVVAVFLLTLAHSIWERVSLETRSRRVLMDVSAEEVRKDDANPRLLDIDEYALQLGLGADAIEHVQINLN